MSKTLAFIVALFLFACFTVSCGEVSTSIEIKDDTKTMCGTKTYNSTNHICDIRDSQVYKFVKIGSQIWLARNLNFTAENSKCYDNNLENCKKYGRLYNWITAKKACPSGWHLPNNDEWEALVSVAGEASIAGKKLKAASGWNYNGNGTDDFGFAALPGGISSNGNFNVAGDHGYWWSATEYNSESAYGRFMHRFSADVYLYSNYKTHLFSVRCVKDE